LIYKNYLVSVLITTHNRADLLPRAIESVLKQTYKNIELIIIDDGSKDNTNQIVDMYIDKYKHIKYIKHDKPLGANKARNNGIKLANGFFIAGLDDDDEFLPTRIEELIRNYTDEYSLVTSNDLLIFDNGKEKSTRKPQVVTLDLMLNENCIGNQVLVKKEYLTSTNGFDENLTASQDYDMWIRIIQKYGNAKVIKKDLQKMYLSNNIKRISNTNSKKFSGYFNFYKKFKNLMNRKQRKRHLSMLYFIRNKEMSFKVFNILLSIYTIKQLIKKAIIQKRLKS
jgi:glycosyltransferase involved in cell wall biosynthesis